MSCSKTLQDLKIAEKVAQDAYDEAKKQDDDAKAALDLATQQDADEEKKRDAGFIPFEISGAGLVSKCRIPTTAVAQLGLFRILLGSTEVTSIVEKGAGPEFYNNMYAPHAAGSAPDSLSASTTTSSGLPTGLSAPASWY